MFCVARVAMLAAWAGVPPHPACHQPRHRPLQLNFLDDYKAETQGLQAGPWLASHEAQEFMDEINCRRMEELRQVARVKGMADGVNWANEELMNVQITAVDGRGLVVQEVLCSASDQRCIAVDVSIPWPPNVPIQHLPEMRMAFTELSRRAYAAALDREDALPPEYQMQQMECNGLMALMNAEFGKLLRFYALKHAREALSPTEQVEQATLTQLNFEGLSLELTTLDVDCYSLDFGMQLTRSTWSSSIVFPNRCQSAEEVEGLLVHMFDNTAAAVEDGRISVDAVAPEVGPGVSTNAMRGQLEQDDARLAAFRSRDARLRRAVRARRVANSNRATARYLQASRQWSYD